MKTLIACAFVLAAGNAVALDFSAPIEKLAGDFRFTEGPVWVAAKNELLFTDIPANRIIRFKDGKCETFRTPSHNANGLTLAECYNGKRLNSPNDTVVKSDGTIYFTDPPYGVKHEERELDFQGIYRIAPNGKTPTLLAKNFLKPNGLALSPDEKVLYIADTERGHIRAFDVAAIDRERILRAAAGALKQSPVTITAFPTKLSEGGPNDFYSNGDYWWPDPSKPNGLPYIKRDGESNPENFIHHRMAVKALRDAVAALGAAYKITGDDRYVVKAVELLQVFFIAPKTRMNPHLNFAQAIPGVSSGRGIGIIDALHLIEVPVAVKAMETSKIFPAELARGLHQWFRELAEWMVSSKNGKEEAAAKNNHSVAFYLQFAVYADFIGDETKLAACRKQFKEVFVPKQMAADGSFPLELTRTKPYGYSIFQLDNMATLCQVLSTDKDNLWSFELPDGRGIRKAVAYLYPFLADKSKWPLKPDVQAWEGWPARQTSLLFAGLAFGEQNYLDRWQELPTDPTDPEVQRNIAITQPLLWLK